MTEPMRALSIQHPWCDAIVLGTKRVENRRWGWPANRPFGVIALHASKEPDYGAGPPPGESWPSDLTDASRFGAVLGVATVTGCHIGYRCDCGPWAVRGQYHWQLSGVRPLGRPVPCRGRLGLWPLPPDVEQQVREQLEASGG